MSRDPYCTCPSCMGTQVADTPCFRSNITPTDFGASRPSVSVTGYIPPSLAEKWDCPKVPADFEPESPLASFRKAWEEMLRNTREQHEEMQEAVVLNALGMTRDEAFANRRRISRHVHPDQDVVLFDGEPVVAIHKPVIRGDELVTTYQLLRKPT